MAGVTWSPNGLASARNLYDGIARHSVVNAEKWLDKIIRTVGVLEHHPEIGLPVELAGIHGVRERLVGTYRILYRYNGTECRVGAVVRAKRDLARAISPEDFE